MADKIALQLVGRKLPDLKLPPLLGSATRSADGPSDPFLPDGYVETQAVFDLSSAARGASDGGPQAFAAQPDDVLVVELKDGSTLITSAARLHDALAQAEPKALGADGAILFERLGEEAAAPRGLLGDAGEALIGKLFSLSVGQRDDAIARAAKAKAAEWSADPANAALTHALEPGLSWLATKALMWAIESKLRPADSLLSWNVAPGSAGAPQPLDEAALAAAADAKDPKSILVFVHGTGSSALGSFGDLLGGDRGVWSALEQRYRAGIYAFEHHTLSASPIENALALARALPKGAHLDLVSHSRGGLVADLLCLDDFEPQIDRYRSELPGVGLADAQASASVLAQLDAVREQQRALLRDLAKELRDKQFVIGRYVRVASPARGTRLAGGNFDVFLSALLALIGAVPFLFGNPAYAAFRRVVLEVAKNRTDAHVVPGIEAMLPDSPMARLLRDAPPKPGIAMAVIAGDIEGGNLLKRLGVLLSDQLLFDNIDNDLVVDTSSMLCGIAPTLGARVLFDRGAEVSHFRYFANLDTRGALRDWLVADAPTQLAVFLPMPGGFVDLDAKAEDERLNAIARTRGIEPADLPVVVILPGIMASTLWVDRSDRVWFDPLDIVTGGLTKIEWSKPNVEAEKLFSMVYGALAEHLATSHRVERFAYDWRQPLDVLADRLGEFIDGLLSRTQQPIRLLAHSMGGLVVRGCIHRRRAVMDALMTRDGARLVMLGTPNQGAHSMVANLLGKGDTLRSLVRLDLVHDMQQIEDIVAGFRGALQLLPKPGFVDTFQGTDEGGIAGIEYGQSETWLAFKDKVFDFWFGDHHSATPTQDALDAGSWLWSADGAGAPALPEGYRDKSIYVCGIASNTPCGIREESGRLKLVGTTRGDGTVTWDSGRIGQIGRTYWLPAEHGALPSSDEYFPALADLLTAGSTARLDTNPPAARAVVEVQKPLTYDVGPPTIDDGELLARGLMGGAPRPLAVARPKRRLEVAVKAMDLRFIDVPILVGHYEHDPIAGPQALIDRELLDGDLTARYNLGLYAGPRGTATVVIRVPTALQRRCGLLSGAVVAGLGPYERPMSQNDLTESVRAGVLRYLLQVIDVLGSEPRTVALATLLIGYNSSANLSVAASVEALVNGVLEANARFAETMGLDIRVARLDIVEIYLDTALTAVYALRGLADKLALVAKAQHSTLSCRRDLVQGEGVRQRLFDRGNQSYWPRLIVSDADKRDEAGAPAMASATPVDASAAAPIAERLRFLYVGVRARAESLLLQRQPGVIEALVRQQIGQKTWSPDLGKMLFQLMVPNDFKDAARQLERIILVVDAYTANLPWELMSAEDPMRAGEDSKLPMALRTPVVRQLESSRFRRQVRQAYERIALVIGNPSVEGFAAAFPPNAEPRPLPAAEDEARAIATVLAGLDYKVTPEIGADRKASDVLAALYRSAWRFVHISAHGIFDEPHRDGRRRSGVVLSDGILIGAAEIDAMETVPELVFLNCCHLGQVDATVRGGNRLAASVARELIQIGVRCVVVAGWAVDDQGARAFGETFYRALLLARKPFGQAVFEARQAVYARDANDITWGAFQAYGDAGWLAEPPRDGADARGGGEFASIDEVLDALAAQRAEIARHPERLSGRENAAKAKRIDRLLAERCPAAWRPIGALQSALGATWADLGQLDDARRAYLAAAQAEDLLGRVPMRDLEQLAAVEMKLGDRASDAVLVEVALQRLADLGKLVASRDAGEAAPALQGERGRLVGEGYKRLANVHARRVLDAPEDADLRLAGSAMRTALQQAMAAYASAAGSPGDIRFRADLALERLALAAVTGEASAHAGGLALLGPALAGGADGCAPQGGLRGFVMGAEVLLVRGLLDESLGAAGEPGELALDEIAKAFRDALSSVTAKPKELDELLDQICLLSRLHRAQARFGRIDNPQAAPQREREAERLAELAERLQPGSCKRRETAPKVVQAGEAATPAPVQPSAAPPTMKKSAAKRAPRKPKSKG